MAKGKSVEVKVPVPSADRPKFGQVGVIVGVCFLIGVAWPRLAGVTLVPRAPGVDDDSDPALASSAQAAVDGVGSAAVATDPIAAPPAPSEPAAPKVSETTQVVIDKSVVVNCRNADEKKLDEKDCDKPNLEDLIQPRLDALTSCEAAADPSGMLSLGLELDFGQRKIVRVNRGKSTTINDAASKALIACAEKEFQSASLEGIEHQHPKYLVYYLVNFVPPGTPLGSEEDAKEGVVEASGSATVMWESAVIRKQAAEGGPVQARLLYGARVFVRARKGDWYRVKYDASNREGWVHRNAIGL